MKQDLDISNLPMPKKRDRIRIERSKYDAMQFDLKMAQAALDNRNKEINGWINQNNELRAEMERLKAENASFRENEDYWEAKYNEVKSECIKLKQSGYALSAEFKQSLERHAAEHAQLDTLARNLRDQRDMARFIAALLGIVALWFAVAVWIGRLVPVG